MGLRNRPPRPLYGIVSRPPDYPRHSQWRLMPGGGENTSSSPGLGCHHKLLNLWWILHHQRWWIVTGCIIDDPGYSLSPKLDRVFASRFKLVRNDCGPLITARSESKLHSNRRWRRKLGYGWTGKSRVVTVVDGIHILFIYLFFNRYEWQTICYIFVLNPRESKTIRKIYAYSIKDNTL